MELKLLGFDGEFEEKFAVHRSRGIIPGRVAAVSHGIYQIWTTDGPLTSEVSGRFEFTASSRMDYPVVGDWVALQSPEHDGPGIIHHVLDRRSCLIRKSAGSVAEAQVMAANVDILMIVMGLDSDFSLRRLERYLLMVNQSGSRPVVVLNKADLCDDVEARLAEVERIVSVKPVPLSEPSVDKPVPLSHTTKPVPVHAISALTEESLDAIVSHITPGVTVAFMGSSGVGKSTIVNRLMSLAVAETGAVREFDGRGRHTTTHREMFRLESGGVLIDTPGMREIQPWAGSDGFSETFSDIEELARECRFSDCSHVNEPGCAIRRALENGDLDPDRWKSYVKLGREEAFLEREMDRKARLRETKRWKNITKNMRQRKKIDPKFMN